MTGKACLQPSVVVFGTGNAALQPAG